MPITWPSSTTPRSAPREFFCTRSARLASLRGARAVDRSRGSVQWESASITGIRARSSVMAVSPAICGSSPGSIGSGEVGGESMYPGIHAAERPDKAVVIMGGGEVVTFRQLDARSNRCAQLLRSRGLGPGSAIGVWMKNCAGYYDPCWAAQRSGLYYTPISTHLTAEEVEYIARDCGAETLFVSAEYGEVARALRERLPRVRAWFAVGGEIPGCERYEAAVAGQPAVPLPDEIEGQDMLYSSGTTGKPKGIRAPLSGRKCGEPDPM